MADTLIARALDSLKLGHNLENWHIATYRNIAVSVAVGVPLFSYWVSNYRAWLALGRGGLPPNPLGWLVQACLHPISRSDTRAPAPWTLEDTEELWGTAGRKSFFIDGRIPPRRHGARPNVPSYVAPQRQTNEQVHPAMLDKMESYLSDLVAANPTTYQLKPSGLEGPFRNAIWLADNFNTPMYLRGTKGEIVHPHDEGSTHLVLSLSDATRAIELGWAERHKLAGAWGEVIPWGFVLVYAPRDGDDFEIWKNFVLAAVKFNAEAVGSGDTSVITPAI
ncbi:hypothetical protein BKA67DRAFT_555013 [Truncatella angustata]|uniref:Luciferase domain-containing protein n=1 Tax=Truncatella angustata TaxID=152316 RepID=A0A9P8UQW9_9PEZI|nr:uncharacterized protein BKA67DRAFT_555013 [Truncatella angustata]KAH6657340.1 hypothetical protein BKA67DRAFT_555013 [Truncatella angustata]